jgi:hypothetical protein
MHIHILYLYSLFLCIEHIMETFKTTLNMHIHIHKDFFSCWYHLLTLKESLGYNWYLSFKWRLNILETSFLHKLRSLAPITEPKIPSRICHSNIVSTGTPRPHSVFIIDWISFERWGVLKDFGLPDLSYFPWHG